ncbi:MAG TPA: ChaN family lipoprotein, partial [Pyrinomonadaceae bacterium]|nr:ChaN family lipoprotein [Pyrinomonadaceae bacterium]
RPWPNYKSDYRPLIEFAKENKIKVIAANAPRRYVNMVSRNGRNALDGLSPQAKIWLAPLPFPKPSDKYAAKFRSLMGASPESSMGLDNILDSQTLWDATMADSIAKVLASKAGSLVIHVNGSFHSESRLGTVEQLLGYRKKTRAIVVTIKQVNDYKGFDPQSDSGLGDFVILTLAKKTPAN